MRTYQFVLRLPFLIGLLMTVVSCKVSVAPPSQDEISGIYVGHYFDGMETFTIERDGTFLQVFKSHEVIIYQSKGTWKKNTNQVIIFTPFMSPPGAWTGNFNEQPRLSEVSPGEWQRNPIRIVFGEDQGYWIVKINDVSETDKEHNVQP